MFRFLVLLLCAGAAWAQEGVRVLSLPEQKKVASVAANASFLVDADFGRQARTHAVYVLVHKLVNGKEYPVLEQFVPTNILDDGVTSGPMQLEDPGTYRIYVVNGSMKPDLPPRDPFAKGTLTVR
jgi:hypothetical protein